MSLEVPGRPTITLELDTADKVAKAKGQTFTIKEGVDYRITVTFRVQHEIVTGLKYLQVVKRKGIRGTRGRFRLCFRPLLVH